MAGKDMVLLIGTFFMGIIAGGYYYVSVFAPSYGDVLENSAVADESSFLIAGEMYGGCEEDGICASFQLLEGREYHYLPYEGGEVLSGTLPSQYKRMLSSALTEEILSQHAKRGAEWNCESQEGGIDHTYTVTRDGTAYVLDTCSTLLRDNIELQEVFLSLWTAFEDPDGAEVPTAPMPEFEFKNITDFFFDRFHSGAKE